MNEINNSNDLQSIITQAIEELKSEQADRFDIKKINLAELERRTGLTRAQLRRLKKNNFKVTPHALTGRKADTTIISAYSGVIDDLLKKGQFIDDQPEEKPSAPVKVCITQKKETAPKSAFAKFAFGGDLHE